MYAVCRLKITTGSPYAGTNGSEKAFTHAIVLRRIDRGVLVPFILLCQRKFVNGRSVPWSPRKFKCSRVPTSTISLSVSRAQASLLEKSTTPKSPVSSSFASAAVSANSGNNHGSTDHSRCYRPGRRAKEKTHFLLQFTPRRRIKHV